MSSCLQVNIHMLNDTLIVKPDTVGDTLNVVLTRTDETPIVTVSAIITKLDVKYTIVCATNEKGFLISDEL